VGNLAFSSTDSNLLASAESSARTGAIKLWDVSEQACVYTFNSDRGNVLSMSFFPGKDKVCLTAVTTTGSWIRLRRRNELLDDFTSEIIDHPDFSDCWLSVLSRCGSFLVTATSQHRISVYNLNTMKRTQSADFLGFRATCIAISPDNKWLAIGDSDGRTRLLQADDLTIEMDLPAQSPLSSVCRVAFDPSSQILASTGTYGVCWLQSLPSRGTFD
jgi:WD40 repeat protein